MTTSLVWDDDAAAVAEVDVWERSPVALADELLAEHDRVGGWVADWDLGDEVLWAAMRPTLARLSGDGREAAREIAGIRGRALANGAGRPLAATDTVMPVVWAREIGAVQQLLGRALADIEVDGDTDVECVAALLRAVGLVRAVSAALATVTAAAA